MKKLILLLFIPYLIVAQEFKIEHKVNEDKTVDFTYKNLRPNSVTAVLNFGFLENTSNQLKIIKKISKPEGRLLTNVII